MHTPYTSNFGDAFSAAHVSICLAVAALLWGQRDRSLASRVLLQAAIALAAVAPWLVEFGSTFGFRASPTALDTILETCAALGTLGVLVERRLGPIAWAIVGEVALWLLTGYLKSSGFELVSLHVVWLGLLVGLHRPRLARTSGAADAVDAPHRGDWIVFLVATGLAVATSVFVLERRIGSSDEWAYTYQAAVFAKLRAYADEPRCSYAFQNFWVFPYMGKQFSQYTPGWPYFMVPFVWIRAPWLAGPVCFGGLAVALARLGRRAMALVDEGTATRREIEAAGWLTALVVCLSSTLLINGGSRFSHVFILATYGWALEALLALADPTRRPTPERARFWGAVLGACCALMLAARPVDGAGLGVGLFVYFVYALARRRFGARVVLAVAVPFALIGGLTLVVLRLQLGKWFTTGYSLNSLIHPWNKFVLSAPKPDQWRWAFPLATGSYVWWPCSLAVGFAGLASIGRRGRALNTALFLGVTPVLLFYAFLDLGRGFDWGYGPRYQMVAVIPMAIGSGVALARLLGRRERLAAFGAAIAAIVVGVVRIAPLVYPYEHVSVAEEDRLQIAIAAAHVHHAVVIASPGTGGVDPMDLTQNLPLDLYPNQDVIVAVGRSPRLEQCVRDLYSDRAIYRANGREQVVLQRER